MTFTKKSQTATEYLVILAVVIVIALIVVGVLGGIPSIGGGAGSSAQKAAAISGKIGVSSVVTTLYGTTFTLRNNQATTIQLTNISIDGEDCYSDGSGDTGYEQGFDEGFGTATYGYLPTLPKTLRAGQELEITCQAFRYTVDSSLSTTPPYNTSDDVYHGGFSAIYRAEYKGNLVGLAPGDQFNFDVTFDYTDTKTHAEYTTTAISLTSPIAGGVGYS